MIFCRLLSALVSALLAHWDLVHVPQRKFWIYFHVEMTDTPWFNKGASNTHIRIHEFFRRSIYVHLKSDQKLECILTMIVVEGLVALQHVFTFRTMGGQGQIHL